MNVKELIILLKQCPKDLPIICNDLWVQGIEYSETGDSGYEISGEIRIITELLPTEEIK